jgi:molybdate transport system regulatory protein
MGLSYQRAWNLVSEMNGLFHEPLVSVVRGGETRGGARLTAVGEEVLERYHAMVTACHAASRKDWEQLQRLLK